MQSITSYSVGAPTVQGILNTMHWKQQLAAPQVFQVYTFFIFR
jgi:hypothetical protein